MIPKPKDSGIRENFETGSRRDTRDGKGRFDLLPCRALRLLALHFENGSAKYGDRNWEKGQPLSRYMDSALRHILKHLEGHRDEPHAVAAAWNLMCLLETEQRIQEGLLPAKLADLPDPLPEKGNAIPSGPVPPPSGPFSSVGKWLAKGTYRQK